VVTSAYWYFSGTGKMEKAPAIGRFKLPMIKISRYDALVLLPMVVCLPFAGIIGAWLCSRNVNEERETPIAKLYRIIDRDVMAVNAGRPELDTVVPFDEIMLLSNDQSRRDVMMHILRRDPFLYLEVLKTAKVSTDVEVTHYATTTIMEIQRDLDIAMQAAEEAYDANPDDVDAANKLISVLKSYIDTGLLLPNRMLQLREQLSKVLEHKLAIFPNSRSAHVFLIENDITLGNYEGAAAVAANMREKWPTDEDSWLKSLHVYMASSNADKKRELSSQMKAATINWSRSGREEAEFLCGY
jgi:hypothetical protein